MANTEINNLYRQRQQLRNQLCAVLDQKNAIDDLYDRLAGELDILNQRLAVAKILNRTPVIRPVVLEIENDYAGT